MSNLAEARLQTVANQLAPYSQEAEEAVIGAVLINPSAYLKIAVFLKANDFYLLRHAFIWQAFENLTHRNEPIDYLTVIQELTQRNQISEVGGPPYLTQLVTNTENSMHAEVYGHIVERLAIRRKLLQVSDQVRQNALNQEINLEQAIGQSQDAFLQVMGRVVESRGETVGQGMETLLTEMETTANDPLHVVGIPTGYTVLDELLGGFEKQDLIILAGRPGMGKSALMGCLALNMAKAGFKVGFFPNEMSKTEFYRRLLAVETGINSRQLRRARGLNTNQWSVIYEAVARIQKLPIYVDDFRSTPTELKAKGKMLQGRDGLDIILHDGMYRAPADSGEEADYARYSQLAESLKNLSKDLDIPVITTHQLNRGCEERKDKRPQLSDLRGSGRIEEEADQVWFLYRDCVYNEATEFPNQADIIVAKNRDGVTGTVGLYFERSITAFRNAAIQRVDLLDDLKARDKAKQEANESEAQ